MAVKTLPVFGIMPSILKETDSAGRTRLQMFANRISRAPERADSEDAAGYSSDDDAADASLKILVFFGVQSTDNRS